MSEIDIYARAEYADALLTARRWKNAIFLVLLLILFGQLALFFAARYTDVLSRVGSPANPVAVAPSAGASTPGDRQWTVDAMHYVLGGTTFFGIVLPILLAVVLCICLKVMLVARTLGAGRMTSSFLTCTLLILLLFPWQAFLNSERLTADRIAFKIPGALYTWNELSNATAGARFNASDNMGFAIVKWARFVAFPVIAVILLLLVHLKSARALKHALGEETPDAPVTKIA